MISAHPFDMIPSAISSCYSTNVYIIYLISHFYTTPQDSGRVLWFQVGFPCVRPSVSRTSVSQSVVRPSVRFSFPDDNSVLNINGFSPNLVCALILWRSGLGLLMGKFRQIFTKLSARDTITMGYYSLTFLLFIILLILCRKVRTTDAISGQYQFWFHCIKWHLVTSLQNQRTSIS